LKESNVMSRHKITRRIIRFGIAGTLAVSLIGCGGEPRVPVYPVSGKITYKGQPPVGAQVFLHPVNESDLTGVVPAGRVKQDGSFTITTYDSDDGAPQGDYVALIQWYKLSPEGAPGPNVIPGVYSNAKKSPARVSVASGPVVIPPITIK
jgi:hypothetical protein